ncbi:hypothetical protein V1523DRAFT_416436 [Lipomyces doorenjongii]
MAWRFERPISQRGPLMPPTGPTPLGLRLPWRTLSPCLICLPQSPSGIRWAGSPLPDWRFHPSRVRALVLVNSGGFTVWNPVVRSICRLLGSPTISRFIMPPLAFLYMNEAICRKYINRARTKEGAWVNASLWRSYLNLNTIFGQRKSTPRRCLFGVFAISTFRWIPVEPHTDLYHALYSSFLNMLHAVHV